MFGCLCWGKYKRSLLLEFQQWTSIDPTPNDYKINDNPFSSRRNSETMTSPNTTPTNWSVKAIPAAFAFGLVPHSYYLIRLMAATKGQMSNAMYAPFPDTADSPSDPFSIVHAPISTPGSPNCPRTFGVTSLAFVEHTSTQWKSSHCLPQPWWLATSRSFPPKI